MALRLAPWAGGVLQVLTLTLALMSGPAQAGNQKEEALSDSVRLALANAIADARPPKPSFRNEAARARYQAWFDEMSRRLAKRLPDLQTRTEFLETA